MMETPYHDLPSTPNLPGFQAPAHKRAGQMLLMAQGNYRNKKMDKCRENYFNCFDVLVLFSSSPCHHHHSHSQCQSSDLLIKHIFVSLCGREKAGIYQTPVGHSAMVRGTVTYSKLITFFPLGRPKRLKV